MAVNKSSLSAGEIIRAILLEDTEVSKRTKKIYPIVQVSTEAILPYIAYRRMALTANPQKAGQPGADTIQFEVVCYTAKYPEGVELAEAVRGALDHIESEHNGLRLRSCDLADSQEDYDTEGGAYMQQLIFNIKI